ncbi:MAG: neuraminidase-like domain-containing protein [Bacteroidota bacterium]
MAATSHSQNINTVFGNITNGAGQPMANLPVEIYDVDMRKWELLSGTLTDKQGNYELHWEYGQLTGAEKHTADIGVKVLSPEKSTTLFLSSMDEVRFNASSREQINVIISQAVPREIVEFDYLVAEVSALAGQVAIADVQESKGVRDVTFLSRELDVPKEKIEHLVVAHKLANLSKMDADFCYAMLRKGTLLRNDLTGSFSARLSVGLHTDIMLLLYDAALTDPQKIETDVTAAASELIVGPDVLKNIQENLAILAQYKSEAEDHYQQEHPQKAVDLLTTIFKFGKLEESHQAFLKNKKDLNAFFAIVTDPAFFDSKGGKNATAKVAAPGSDKLNKTVISQAIQTKTIESAEDLRALARLDAAAWEQEISLANAQLTDPQQIRMYAEILVQKFEKEFPTVAFAAQLERETKQVLDNQSSIVSFLNQHEDFDLTNSKIDVFLNEKKVKESEKAAIAEGLKSVQRIFRLMPSYQKTLALREEKIHSAYHIVSAGQNRFVKEIAPKAGISEREAREVYRKAESRHTAAMLLIGELQDSVSVKEIASFETDALTQKLDAVSQDFPNLQSLFKLTDMCECEHCRSVYSPAAYLVEILQFLDKRSVVSGDAKSVLLNRRPDLGEIDLSCSNANTPVKYIDLVCELLEDSIAPDQGIAYTGDLSEGSDPLVGKISSALLLALQGKGLPVTANALIHATEQEFPSSTLAPHYLRDTGIVCKIVHDSSNNFKVFRLRQTFSTAEELDAAPEYVNEAAYAELLSKKFAFGLPFDLNHTEAKAYLNRFGVDRAELMQAFQNYTSPAKATIAAERLGITDAEKSIMFQAPIPNDNAAQQAFWNVPAPWEVVSYLQQLDHFLSRTDLSYQELDRLLRLDFVDPVGNLFIQHNDLSCDTSQKEIANLDLAAMDRIHRFLRMQKKTGWRFEVLDAVISQARLGAGNLNETCLLKASQLLQIHHQSGIKIEELVGCFGDIPHTLSTDKAPKPLYHQIFLNKAKNGTIDEGLLPEKVDGSQAMTPYVEIIGTALGVTGTDLGYLLNLLPNQQLTFGNLSHLFASSLLLKKMKLSAQEYSILLELTGIDPTIAPAAFLEFLELAQSFKQSPLKANEVKFLLNHKASNLNEWVLSDAKIELLLGELKEGYQQIHMELASAFDDNQSAQEQLEVLTSVLSSLADVSEADVQTILQFLHKSWGSVAEAKQFIDAKLDKGIDKSLIHAALDALDAAGADTEAEQLELVRALLDTIAAFEIARAKRASLTQILSAAFRTSTDLMEVLLSHAVLKQATPAMPSIAGLLSDSLESEITSANYPEQYGALQLLHKMTALLLALEISSTDAVWYFQHNQALGWLELDTLPYEGGQTSVDLNSYVSFVQTIELARMLKPVNNPADSQKPVSFFSVMERLLPGSSLAKELLMNELALLSAHEQENLASLDAHFFSTFDIANYREIAQWKRMLTGASLMRQLSASLPQVQQYIQSNLGANEVASLRASLKSRYSEEVWLTTLKEIMDSIRPQKRDALVAYLLATNPGMKHENDLFEYLLVDVEMESCMPSSRIVLAHNSIQLFVQRCLMGLEPDAIADIDADPNWSQWKWMKNYRVWEANRKVFLYPENWYDVSLTSDKSFLLEEFIDELQQNEMTQDTAEQALHRYLAKLDTIAFLEVKATWYDVANREMHVFARTKGGDPSTYYYRKFEQERHWTPWEKVELDISGDHLMAFVRNNRLHLAWPIYSEVPEPTQTASIPDATPGNNVELDRPKRKLKIQLAISEYSNHKWQPKKVSKDSLLTPSQYFANYEIFLNKENYNFIYFEYADQVLILRNYWSDRDHFEKVGAFDLAGCKGYPELSFAGHEGFPDFLPDFKDSRLKSQRYHEVPHVQPDDMSVQNGVSSFDYYEVLGKTPGNFRISYPHQFTLIDIISMIYHFLMRILNDELQDQAKNKIPLGTLLPYFKEDSQHAYVIIPGYYTNETGKEKSGFHDSEKRTASDVFQFIQEIANWYKKMIYDFQTTPPADDQEAIQRIVTDPELHDLLKEVSKYEALDIVLNFLIGKTGNHEFDDLLSSLVSSRGLVYGEQFKNMYHPLVCALRTTLMKDGIVGLMKRETQLQQSSFDFESHYAPNHQVVPESWYKQEDGSLVRSFPIEDIDFSSGGSYSTYNWDLFFRVPLHIASKLTQNQRFEEAMSWFHYIFNPTGALPGNGVQKYWVTKPFYLNQDADYIAQRIDSLLYAVSDGSDPNIQELEYAISAWRTHPFMPDVIARFRPVAYQKAVLMKYIDNLVEWGDYLFRQDTMESIAQATQLYILADKLLGPKPQHVPPAVSAPSETYNQLEARLDSFGNALIGLENILPDLSVLPEGGAELPAPPISLSMLYFCVPANEKMMAYWDKVADRLFKIRHCQNIEGVERSLALFAPPIDPAMLVKAAASGLDISSVIAGLNAPIPLYRFEAMSSKATELAIELRGLGSALLQALEKKDAEALSLLRSESEQKVLDAAKDIKQLQIQETVEYMESLFRSKKMVEEKHAFYRNIEKINRDELLSLEKLTKAHDLQEAAESVKLAASLMYLVPTTELGVSGFGGSTVATIKIGGLELGQATNVAGDILSLMGVMAANESSRLSVRAGHERRFDDWKLQERQAELELDIIEKEITGMEVRQEITEVELRNHNLQIENAQQTDEFLRSKFTNKELYDWMIGQISSVYFRSYQLAHDFAKKAERSYQFELGNSDSFISYGYWDSMKKGLQSADHLMHDIKRMETSYMDKNRREYEMTKHISLSMLDPLALIRLRATGVCDFDMPEVLFDMDQPGHYFRRIKSVSVSLPCIAGPYTSVSSKLSLVSSKYRKNANPTNLADSGYVEDPGNDERFVYKTGAIQSIATSHGQNDNGMFELNFRDERYLPFEGAGAVSSWRLELPTEVRQFDYDSISDVILHIQYTAREGGSGLRTLANEQLKTQLETIHQDLSKEGLHVAINMKHDLPNAWHLLKQNHSVNVTIDKHRLPYIAQPLQTLVEEVSFVAKVAGNPTSFPITVKENPMNLAFVSELGLCIETSSDITLDTSFSIAVDPADIDQLDDLVMVVKYVF